MIAALYVPVRNWQIRNTAAAASGSCPFLSATAVVALVDSLRVSLSSAALAFASGCELEIRLVLLVTQGNYKFMGSMP